MKRALKVGFLSVVPSPYQRDLFGALADREGIDLSVFYLEKASPDSPWPGQPLRKWESVLPGRWFPFGNARIHVNQLPPAPASFDLFVFNSLMSVTAQRLMRRLPPGVRSIFWGERFTGSGWLHRIASSPLSRARAIAAIGALAVEDYRRRFPKVRVANIPYHCDLGPFVQLPLRPTTAEPVFLFCGQMIRRKGVDLLLGAFSQLPVGRLLLVGREAELPEMMARLPAAIRGRIEYAGFQSPDALPAFFGRADIFVLPSRHDGWGVVVNQALGAGLPLVCSDAVGAAHDLIRPGTNGVMVKAGSVDDLTGAMRGMADDRERRIRFGRASREMAAAWSPEAGADRWCALFREIAEE